jgi:hypothetical protein
VLGAGRHGPRPRHQPRVRAAGEAQAPLPCGALPAELATALREAAHVADYGLLTELITRLPVQHAGTATALRAMTEAYAYDEIEALLRE